MINLLKKLFGLGPSIDFNELMKQGAIVVDVRTKDEFKSSHIKGAINIPLNTLPQRVKELNPNKPIITCCASGMRSASARSILKSKGFKQVYNGGGWTSLKNKLN